MSRRRKHGRPLHGILLLDKATGCSSNHALQQVKRLFDARKAGHTGSLDPLATGMLPICFGEATKLSHYLLEADKSYITGARLGSTTTTADAEGDVLQQREVAAGLTLDRVQQIAERFVGEIEQVPPMYSALKIDGQRLYRLARQGKTVERKARRVTIHSIQVLHLEAGLVAMDVHCSKGTYIRTLVEDIGEAIGCGAHVESLRRTTVSPFTHHTMHAFTALEAQLTSEAESPKQTVSAAASSSADEIGDGGHVGSSEEPVTHPASRLDELLLPADAMLTHMPRCELTPAMAGLFAHGQLVPAVPVLNPEPPIDADSATPAVVRVYGPDGLIGIGEQEGGRLKPQRILNFRPPV